jgi:uncharacterized protein
VPSLAAYARVDGARAEWWGATNSSPGPMLWWTPSAWGVTLGEGIGMARPVHFDITADDPDRAVGFYRSVFGWSFDKWGGGGMEYWLITTGDEAPGINGGMSRRGQGSDATMNTIGVESIDDTLRAIEGAGGRVERPKGPIAGVGWFAVCADTEGNSFGVMQPDESAA